MRHLTRRRLLMILLGLTATLLVFLGRSWKESSDRGGQKPAEPFRIAGNL